MSRLVGVFHTPAVAALWFAVLIVIAGPLAPAVHADPSTAETVHSPVDVAIGPAGEQLGGMLDRASNLIGLTTARGAYPGIDGGGYTIAIIDSGVDRNHPAFAGRYVGGYDYVNLDGDPDDDNGHGTHVAGIALSADPTHTGLAPGANFVALKVLDHAANGSFSNIEKALRWVGAKRQELNIVAVNLSVGTTTVYNDYLQRSTTDELADLKNAGIFIAAAAGNSWQDRSPDPPGVANPGVAYPGADASTVAVGSVWSADFGPMTWRTGAKDNTSGPDRLVSHSNRSETLMDVLAPGAILTSTSWNWEGAGADFVTKSGTSMATPAVAGLAVLIRQAIEENWEPADWPTGPGWQDTILDIMRDNAVWVHDGDDEDDNVANLNALLPRIDVKASLDAVVPEPATLALLLAGGAGLLVRRRRR